MADRPEDLNLPNAVISRLAKEAVRICNFNISNSRNCYNAKVDKLNIPCISMVYSFNKPLGMLDLTLKKLVNHSALAHDIQSLLLFFQLPASPVY